MKSIKPGRGPSMMGGIAALCAAIFGVAWTIGAAAMGAPIYFLLFGVVFILLGVGQAVYQFRNAAGKNRCSLLDITENGEEPDPLDELVHRDEERAASPSAPASGKGYCPYCGRKVKGDYAFCPDCGKKLPDR